MCACLHACIGQLLTFVVLLLFADPSTGSSHIVMHGADLGSVVERPGNISRLYLPFGDDEKSIIKVPSAYNYASGQKAIVLTRKGVERLLDVKKVRWCGACAPLAVYFFPVSLSLSHLLTHLTRTHTPYTHIPTRPRVHPPCCILVPPHPPPLVHHLHMYLST